MTQIERVFSNSIARLIYAQQDKKKNGESPKRGAAVAEEGKRNTNHRHDTDHHPHVDDQVKEEDAHHGIAVDPPENGGLSLRQL